MRTTDPAPQDPPAGGPRAGVYRAALLLALAGTLGSLALSIVLDLKACPLCFYQRSFVMAALGTLTLGLLVPGAGSRRTAIAAALVCAVAGFGVAVFHVQLEATGVLECPDGILALGSAPQQSLVMFTLLLGMLAFATFADAMRRAGIVALLLGAAFAVGSIVSSPPLPPPPQSPYDGAPIVCRPPYEPAA
jgi:disulfide bond formation protein DsbB